MSKPTAVIFDVDRTILDGMSGYSYSKHMLDSGALSLMAKLRIAKAVIGYRTGLFQEEAIVEIGVTAYAGKRVEDLERLADECVKKELAGRCYTEALATLENHVKKGDHVLLASGSSNFIVEALARHVGAHGAVATSAFVKNGKSTRQIAYPLCYQEGKLALVETYLEKIGLPLETATVYTDNLADLSLLEKVARPVAVNAQQGLSSIAHERGWEALSWETPVDSGKSFTGSNFPLKGEV